eukprot:2540819-Pyramimonas_sp.AAC.1
MTTATTHLPRTPSTLRAGDAELPGAGGATTFVASPSQRATPKQAAYPAAAQAPADGANYGSGASSDTSSDPGGE